MEHLTLLRRSNEQTIILDLSSALGQGGEAQICAVSQDETLVAKVYHKPHSARTQKLLAMLANPPEDPMAKQGKTSLAWPVDLLLAADGSQRVVGFLMPRVTGTNSILEFYHPKTRRQKCPFFNYLYLHRAARNLAAAVGALHARGYCIGDVNESNILVSDTALVTLVDTDSFQVREPDSDVVYRCCVGKPEFTPPELQGKNFRQLDRLAEHDLFGLAVLIFQLLMEGNHPFSGIFQGTGDPPSYEARIKAGHFTYSRQQSVPYCSMPTAPLFEILHPALQQLFVQCFEQGHARSQMRPSAQTWQNTLEVAEKALVTCSINNHHRYGNHLNDCPWCARALALGGRDPFPSTDAVQRKQHLQPLPPKKVSPLVGQDSQPAFTGQTLATLRPQLTTIAPKKRLSPFVLGLLKVAILGLGLLNVTLIVSVFLDISPDFNVTSIWWDSDLASPNPKHNSDPSLLNYYEQGHADYNLGELQTLTENSSKALCLNPNPAQAYVDLGSARYVIAHSRVLNREYGEGLKDCNQALSLNP